MTRQSLYGLNERIRACHEALLNDPFIKGAMAQLATLANYDMPTFILKYGALERVHSREILPHIIFWKEKIEERQKQIIKLFDIETNLLTPENTAE